MKRTKSGRKLSQKPAAIVGGLLRNGEQTAELLGISTKWLRELAQRGVLPRANGAYPWPAVRVAFNSYLEGKTEGQPEALKVARARLVEIQRKIAELDLGQKRGELVPIDEIRREVGERLERIRTRLLNAPGKYATQWSACKDYPEAQRQLEQIMLEVLAEVRSAFVSDRDERPPRKPATKRRAK